jgi:hypothetical protein
MNASIPPLDPNTRLRIELASQWPSQLETSSAACVVVRPLAPETQSAGFRLQLLLRTRANPANGRPHLHASP